MHGFILFNFKKYIEKKQETATWLQMLRASGVGYKPFWPSYIYSDEEMYALIGAASDITNTSKTALLQDFGIYLAPGLMDMYRDLINPEWNSLDLIENTESRVHTAVRAKDLAAKPPQLQVKRISDTKLEINYFSKRKLCSLLKGIAMGVAEHYGEQIEIEEPNCMHRGDSRCIVIIELTA